MTIAQESLAKQVMKWPAQRRIEFAEELRKVLEKLRAGKARALP